MSIFGSTASANTNPNKSTEVQQPPADSVTSLCFSPKANLLVATSWDNQVRCWEVMGSGTNIGTVPKAAISHEQPVLCSAWKDDGTTVFSGGCDKQVKMWPLSGSQPVTIAMHDAPVRELAWIPEMNLLVTGSWDKTLRYWDLRQQNPVHVQQLPERCYALTVKHPLMVAGTADKNLIVFNLQNPQDRENIRDETGKQQLLSWWKTRIRQFSKLSKDGSRFAINSSFFKASFQLRKIYNRRSSTEFKRIPSPLKYQTRCLAAFPDQQGFLVGSIEGRVGVHHLDDSSQGKNFTFKCHREGNDIYSVNSLNFHPTHGTFATAGSDGAFNFWDKDSKQRLKAMSRCSQPIPCSAFNNDGSIYAYAVCYDWSKGAENHNPSTAKTYIYLHFPQESDVKGKPRIGGSSSRK
ncbi:hypothetical protein P3S68_032745 [Capsicum galapagoense]